MGDDEQSALDDLYVLMGVRASAPRPSGMSGKQEADPLRTLVNQVIRKGAQRREQLENLRETVARLENVLEDLPLVGGSDVLLLDMRRQIADLERDAEEEAGLKFPAGDGRPQGSPALGGADDDDDEPLLRPIGLTASPTTIPVDDDDDMPLIRAPNLVPRTPEARVLIERFVPTVNPLPPYAPEPEPPEEVAEKQEELDSLYRLSAGVEPAPLDPQMQEAREGGKVEADAPPSVAQLNELTEYMVDDLELALQFRGYYVTEWGWLMWLQDNLPRDTLCVYRTANDEGGDPLQLQIVQTKPQRRAKGKPARKFLTISDQFFDAIRTCRRERPGARFVIGVLALPQHANGIVFDFETRRLTRFEPHGGHRDTIFDQRVIDDAFQKDFIEGRGRIGGPNGRPMNASEKAMFSGWTYVAPKNYCGWWGPQAIENRATSRLKNEPGYCSAWSLIYMHFRVMNPTLTDSQASNYFKERPEKLLKMIREYAAYIVSNVEGLSAHRLGLKVGDLVTVMRNTREVGKGYIIMTFPSAGVYRIKLIPLSLRGSYTKLKKRLIWDTVPSDVIPVTDPKELSFYRPYRPKGD